MSRRDEVLAAAVDVLGDHGLHGLTHRRVDKAAHLPEGTTSNHFRSRDRLLAGVVGHLVDLEFAVWDQAGFDAVESAEDLVSLATTFVSWALGPGRTRSVARISLLEAAMVNDEVSSVLRRARRTVEGRAVDGCAAAGVEPGAVAMLLDVTDAVVFRQLALPEPDFDVDAYVRRAVMSICG